MRIIRIKLKPDVVELLGEIAQQYSITEVGFAEDIFCLVRLKGSGLPTDDRMRKMAAVIAKNNQTSEALTLMSLRKRKHVLADLTKLTYFKALCLDCAHAPHQAVARLLETFRQLTRKVQQAQCASCKLRSQCAFGQQFGDIVKDISRVPDADYARKVHADCPELPDIEQLNQFHTAVSNMQQLSSNSPQGVSAQSLAGQADAIEQAINAMDAETEETALDDPQEDGDLEEALDAEEDAENLQSFGGSAHDRDLSNTSQGTATGQHFARVSEDFVKQLSVSQLALFDLGKQLASALGKATKDKYKPTVSIDDKQHNESMKSVSDVAQANASQYALSDEQFDAKVGKKTLQVRKFEEPEPKKFLLYGLLDVSYSMQDPIGTTAYSMLTRGNVCSTLFASLLHRVKTDGGISFLRFFADRPGPMSAARNDQQFDHMIRRVVDQDYNGGGTNIPGALRQAVNDIIAAKDEIAKSEIIVVTDGEDSFSDAEVAFFRDKMKTHKIVINVMDVNPAPMTGYRAQRNGLKHFATKYLQIKPNSLTINSLVELVK